MANSGILTEYIEYNFVKSHYINKILIRSEYHAAANYQSLDLAG